MSGLTLVARSLAALSLFAGAAAAQDGPATPYYSIDLGRYDTREQALEQLQKLPATDLLRAEKRPHGWYVRAGAWADRAQAETAQKTWARQGTKARVLHVERSAPWMTLGDTSPAPVAVAAVAAPAAAPAAQAPAASTPSSDLTGLELEQLLAMHVTGVTGRSASYLGSPAAIFVLTGDDIRRAGVRNIAEALRLVPGLQVYRSSAEGYTVTSRGLGADKLQVLVDGRSVYSPLNSTVSVSYTIPSPRD